MSLILPWSYIIYLFAFCVIQSCLCEMALLLFKNKNQNVEVKITLLSAVCGSAASAQAFERLSYSVPGIFGSRRDGNWV